jgi:hypothetical protein
MLHQVVSSGFKWLLCFQSAYQVVLLGYSRRYIITGIIKHIGCCCFSISKLIRVMGLVSASSSHYRGIKKAKLINIDPKKQLSSPY